MEQRWIDRLARQVATTTTRRGLARLGLGGVLAGGASGADEVLAACRAPKQKCAKGNQCCSGKCKKGKCGQCGSGQTFCLGVNVCADLQTSPLHCGSCQVRCALGQHCVDGTCTCDETSCDGCCDGSTCRPGTDSFDCGANGEACHACELGQECIGGACACTPTSCPDGCCDGTTCEPASDDFCGLNGGACAFCPGGETCLDGVCVG